MIIKQYKGLKAVKRMQKITDAHVMQELENIRRQRTRSIPITDRSAAVGDEVIIDYAGFVGDYQFPGGTAEKQPLTLGSGTFIPGFEEQLVGANVGDKVDVKVTFPTAYHAPELAGKEAVFHCTVHAVQTKEVPELNDDFARQFQGISSLDELKVQLKAQLQEYADQMSQNKVCDELLKALTAQVEDVTFDEAQVRKEIDIAVDGFARQLQQRGMPLDHYLKACGHTLEEMQEELRPQAENTLKARMALNEICRIEGITVTDAEVEAAYEQVARMYNTTAEQIKQAYGADNEEDLRKDILLKKAIAVLEANAEITVQAPAEN